MPSTNSRKVSLMSLERESFTEFSATISLGRHSTSTAVPMHFLI
jgi:hypothetical protein